MNRYDLASRRGFLGTLANAAIGLSATSILPASGAAQVAAPRNVRMVSEKKLLGIDDLIWRGQAKVPDAGVPWGGTAGQTSYSCGANAVRYVGGQRRILMANWHMHDATYFDEIGDLVEYSLPTLSQGPITSAGTATETMRWTDWCAVDQARAHGGNGVLLGSLYWDEVQQVIWYTLYGYYSSYNAPFLGATRLNSNGTTTKYGMWYYRTIEAQLLYWKQVFGYIVPIPQSAQADFGGRTIGIGAMPGGVISPGQFGPGFHAIQRLPELSEPAGSIVPLGLRIADFTPENGGSQNNYQCHRDANYTVPGSMHTPVPALKSGSTTSYYSVASLFATDLPGTQTGDAIYFGREYPFTNLYLVMSTPGAGGQRVWEYSKGGGAWGLLSPTFTVGTPELAEAGAAPIGAPPNAPGATQINAWWDEQALTDWRPDTVAGVASTYWIRIRTVVPQSVGGRISRVQTGEKQRNANSYPDGDVGYWFMSHDNIGTYAWVDTPDKHGIVCFARMSHGAQWYGIGTGYIKGTWYTDPDIPTTSGYGYHSTSMDPELLVFDPMDMREAATGARPGNSAGIRPVSIGNWHEKWPNIVALPSNLGTANTTPWITTYNANGGTWDPVAKQLIWVAGRSYRNNYSVSPTIQVFDV